MYLFLDLPKHCIKIHSMKPIWFCLHALTKYVPCPFRLRLYHRNSKSTEITFCSHRNANEVIATTFYTWHASCAVVAWANICCDQMTRVAVTAKRTSHRIWESGQYYRHITRSILGLYVNPYVQLHHALRSHLSYLKWSTLDVFLITYCELMFSVTYLRRLIS